MLLFPRNGGFLGSTAKKGLPQNFFHSATVPFAVPVYVLPAVDSAAAVIVAAAVITAPLAVAAAADDEDNGNDDPAAVAAEEALITHSETSQFDFSAGDRPQFILCRKGILVIKM